MILQARAQPVPPKHSEIAHTNQDGEAERLTAGRRGAQSHLSWRNPSEKDALFDAVRVLMVTSETEIDRVQSALSAGANEYLMKPFTPEALLEKLSMMGLHVQGVR